MTVIADKIQCVYLFSMCMHMHVLYTNNSRDDKKYSI